MQLLPITKPTALPVTLAEQKAHMRVDHSDEDLSITSYIATATAALDGRDGLLGRALMSQTWRVLFNSWAGDTAFELPLPPAISVQAVAWGPDGGSATTINPVDYHLADAGNPAGSVVVPAVGKPWPGAGAPGALWIDFTAGYGSAADVPEPIRQAIRMHAAHLYENRESVLIAGSGARAAIELPAGYTALIEPFRLHSFGEPTASPGKRVVIVNNQVRSLGYFGRWFG